MKVRWFLCLLVLITPSIVFAQEPVIVTKYKYNIQTIVINSKWQLNKRARTKIADIVINSKRLFFNKFENIEYNTCIFDDINIFIINEKELNNKQLFRNDDNRITFGRYFWLNNNLYVTREIFKHNEYLAHELSHYFYDECAVFHGINEEESRAYKFQDLYKRIFQ